MVRALLPTRPAMVAAMINGRRSVQELATRARWVRLLLLRVTRAWWILLSVDRRWTGVVIVRCVIKHNHAYRCPITAPRQLTLIQYLLHRVIVADHIRLINDQGRP